MRYRIRERPGVVVDAFQLTKARLIRPLQKREWPTWLQSPSIIHAGRGKHTKGRLLIRASGRANDVHLVQPDWWVIRDPKGQLSITGPDSFDAAYEPVPE